MLSLKSKLEVLTREGNIKIKNKNSYNKIIFCVFIYYNLKLFKNIIIK